MLRIPRIICLVVVVSVFATIGVDAGSRSDSGSDAAERKGGRAITHTQNHRHGHSVRNKTKTIGNRTTTLRSTTTTTTTTELPKNKETGGASLGESVRRVVLHVSEWLLIVGGATVLVAIALTLIMAIYSLLYGCCKGAKAIKTKCNDKSSTNLPSSIVVEDEFHVPTGIQLKPYSTSSAEMYIYDD